MKKNNFKRILISLFRKTGLVAERTLQQMSSRTGDNPNSIRKKFIEKLKENNKENNNHIYYYTNVEKDKRESRTFSQVKKAIEKVQKILEENNLSIYIGGGTVPYLLLNQESGRLHDDIDTICKLEDIEKLRELFKKEGLYIPEWDSKNHAKAGRDYGFEMKIEGVPFGIYPFEYKDGTITQYSFDPYSKTCKTKTIPIEQLSDYIYTYKSRDGKTYRTISLEYIKLTKDNTGRPKDIVDSKKISEYGIRNDVMSRIVMYKEVKSER